MAKGSGFSCSAMVLLMAFLPLVSGCASAPSPANLQPRTTTVSATPLMAAAARGDIEEVTRLSESGAPLNSLTENGTPLMAAVRAGEDRVVWYLLSRGADADLAGDPGVTPLMEAGANVNVSQGGESLLMKIVASGDLLTAEMLLAAGADVNHRASDGSTALSVARSHNNRDLEMLLIQAGAEF